MTEKNIIELHPSYWKYWIGIGIGIVFCISITGAIIGIPIIFLIRALRKNTLYRITNRRIIAQRQIFTGGKTYEEISLTDIRAINFTQSILQSVSDCGNIQVATSASLGTGIMALQWIKNPNNIQEVISKLKESPESELPFVQT